MSRFLLTVLLIIPLAACGSSKKETNESKGVERSAESQGPAELGGEPRDRDEGRAPDDDDSARGDDDDSARGDDDDSAAPAQDSMAAEPTGDDDSAAGDNMAAASPEPEEPANPTPAQSPPPPEFEPPPPGQKGILEKAAALMTGTRFRWIQGSKDVAYGLYGAPVMLNLWSCTDKNIDSTLEWLKTIEKTYSDQMLSILVPANVAERSLTGQDNICGRSIRFGRSLGVDVGKGVMHELYVKELPTMLVFDSQGTVVAKHEGPIAAGSSAAKKLEGALEREMAPLFEGRALAP